jgi:hypothetical protein
MSKKNVMTEVFVVWAKSESCDDYGPWVFAKKLTKKQLKKFLREVVPEEFDDAQSGPGAFGSWLHVESRIVPVQES